MKAAQDIALAVLPATRTPAPAQGAAVALLFSPHPDDECLTGLLPLRLSRESGMRIINVPVTYGSCVERQAERHEELRSACAYLGWGLLERDLKKEFRVWGDAAPGFPDVGTAWNPVFQSLEQDDIIVLLQRFRPALISLPHALDGHERHRATHHMVMAALTCMPEDFACAILETEYWETFADPNLLVEGGVEEVADLVAAASCHAGEMRRNPYHLRLPAWMIDSVRRGAEMAGNRGGPAPGFHFGTLYRLQYWCRGEILQRSAGGKCFLSLQYPASTLLDEETT